MSVSAGAETALAAAKAVTAREAPLLRVLFALRGLHAPADRPLWEAMAAEGFATWDDVTLVAVGRPWRIRDGLAAAGEFAAFAEPGWAKLALDFSAAGDRLVTETRVQLTDARSRRAFGRYWLVVRPFSGLTRRSWLRAAKRRAERTAAGP